MDGLSITDVSDKPIAGGTSALENPPTSEVATPKVGNGKGLVVQRNYVLNDRTALKKKMGHEGRKEPYNLGTEARDGSNMVVQMRTSFFEYVKAEYIKDLVSLDGIVQVENALGAKASTEHSGDAYVEYSLDVSFKLEDKVHTIKLTAYTTSCRIMFQPVGEPGQPKVCLGNKSIPRYFVDTFFLPWCQMAYAKKSYNEEEMIEAIRNEIRRLDLLKLEGKKNGKSIRGRLASVPSSEVRCVARGCKYTGLNSSNKSAVGLCAKCGCFEHFECSKTKQEGREDILKGGLKYFCSLCFSKNPSMVAFDASKMIKGSNPLTPPAPSGSVLQLTSNTKSSPVPHPVDPVVKYTCKICSFETETHGV